ncbi:MAG: DUF4269 domain-containing protein [Aeromonas sp.]
MLYSLYDDTAALAAVFPSALTTAPNWRQWAYLARGNVRQRQLFAQLTHTPLWAKLTAHTQDVALISSLCLGIDIASSDVDILCQHPSPVQCAADLAADLTALGANCRFIGQTRQHTHIPAVWLLEGWLTTPNQRCYLELYITEQKLEQCHGWRHLTLMARLLARFGWPFYAAVLRLRAHGLKGEAAMAKLLGLNGCPYAALLALEAPSLWEALTFPSLGEQL